MAEKAYIVEALRTAGGKRDGNLSLWHPADLGAKVLDEIVLRLDMDPALVDDVIFGCVDQVGAQSGNVARNAVLSSSFPESVPGTSVDRQCGSSQQAIHFAIQAVMSGTQDIVIGGGVEVMSLVPIGASVTDGMKAGHGFPFDSNGMKVRYPDVFFSQFTGAELVADKWNLSRQDLDEFAFESHQKAAHATETKYFDREILILDESLNAIDTKTSKKIIKNILLNYPNLTIILVTHSIELAKMTKKIYKIQNKTLKLNIN